MLNGRGIMLNGRGLMLNGRGLMLNGRGLMLNGRDPVNAGRRAQHRICEDVAGDVEAGAGRWRGHFSYLFIIRNL